MTLLTQGNGPIEFVAETRSTNEDLTRRIRNREPLGEGAWLVADRQTAGRGRLGREWFDGAGNFMGSTVVHRRPADPPPASLALLSGLALHATVEPLLADGRASWLKWPNDVMIGDAKLAGILLEALDDSVVVGIGVNLASAPNLPDRETMALSELGIRPDRNDFAAALARDFAVELARWRDFGLGPIVSRWLAAAHPIGTALQVADPAEGSLAGTFAGLTQEGALQLRMGNGRVRTVHAGDVLVCGQR